MRRQALIAMMTAGLAAAQAADYQYLTIEQTDGTTVTLTAEGLNITYADGNMKAVNGQESATLPLTTLKRMYFTNEKTATAIATPTATADDWNDAGTEIYDLGGRRLPQGTKPARGLYIFKKGNTTTKKLVR